MPPPEDFNPCWDRAASMHAGTAPELRLLVGTLYRELHRHPTDDRLLRTALEDLLVFLASPTGRTDANCRVVDYFLTMPEVYGCTVEWAHVSPEFQDILTDMMGLHDTITYPEIARRCESTPEQLLARLRHSS